MRTPFKHQIEGKDFLIARKKAILGDEMGLGKTFQAIMAAGEDSEGDKLIICPASLKENWEKEIHSVYPGDEVFIFGRDPMELFDRASWYVINYDILEKYEEVLSGKAWDTVIPDEAHYIKNNSIRSKQTLKLCRAAKRVYLLTGTMVQNRPIELWNLLVAINHPLTRKDAEHSAPWINFIRRYCAAFQADYGYGRFWDTSGASNLDELRVRVKDSYLRRKKEEVLDMPDKIRTITPVVISDAWMAKYETAFEEYLKFLKEHPIDELPDIEFEYERDQKIANVLIAQHLVELGKLKQVASLAKLDRINEVIQNMIDSGEKVVVFTCYKGTIKQIRAALKKNIGRVELTGETTPGERQKVVDKFQTDPKCKVFLGNIKAAGVGITLTASTKVIFADLDWNPANHDQAEDRCHRIGQTGTVNVYYYLATGTVEEDIWDMLDRKREIIDAIMEGGKVKKQGRSVAGDLIRKLSTSGAGLHL